MPPAKQPGKGNDNGKGKGKPRKRSAPSIRDAAASAAGSAPTSSASEPRASRPAASKPASASELHARKPAAPRRRARPSQQPKNAPQELVSPAPASEPEFVDPPERRPPFPDFDNPPARWDPWDETIGTDADGRSPDFDPQRTLGEWLEAVIPPDAQIHFIRAGQEFAAGVQTTVDHHLGRGAGGEDGPDGATRIEIE